MTEQTRKGCWTCGSADTRHRCGGCKQAFYCNEVCQRKDWRNHKEKCKELAQEKMNALGNQLFRLCCEGSEPEISALIAKGADVNFVVEDGPSNGSFPLLVACKEGKADVIRALLSAGALPNKVGREPPAGGKQGVGDQYTPIGLAALLGHDQAVRELISHGASVNQKFGLFGNSAIYLASLYGQNKVLVTLIENGGDVNQYRTTGEAPLHPAACRGNNDSVKILLAAGANIHHRDPYYGGTVLHLAIGYHDLNTDTTNVVRTLVDGGVDVHVRDKKDESALDRAMKFGFEAAASIIRSKIA